MQTTIVDVRKGGELGGVCLHEGCIPSKTLLNMIETMYAAENGGEFGIAFGKPKINYFAVRAGVEKTIKKLSAGLESSPRNTASTASKAMRTTSRVRNLALIDASIPAHPLQACADRHRQRAKSPSGTAVRRLAHHAARSRGVAQDSQDLAHRRRRLHGGGDGDHLQALGSMVTIARMKDDCCRSGLRSGAAGAAVALEIASVRPNARPTLVEAGKKAARLRMPDVSDKPVLFEIVVVSAGHIGNTVRPAVGKDAGESRWQEFVVVDATTLRTE